MNTDDKVSVLIQPVTIIVVTGGRYIILNRPDISAVECCNRACVFPCVLDQCSTTELQKPSRKLGREFSIYIYIYINEMVMPVKYKGILVIIFGIYTRCQ